MDEHHILIRLREICLVLPGVIETTMHGHPTFRVGKDMFTCLHGREGDPALCFKVGTNVQEVFLQDPRFYRTPHIGRYGWVSLRMQGELDWEEIAELLRGSHQAVVDKKRRPKKRA